MPVRGAVARSRAQIPAAHSYLVDEPYWAALTTVMPDGRPQTTPVWCNQHREYVLTNTMLSFRKEKNLRTNPRVTLLICDPHNPLRIIEIRGLVVEMTEVGAVEHDDLLAQLYTGNPNAHFFGDAVPAALAATHHPVKVTIMPTRVRVEDGEPATRMPSDVPSESTEEYESRPADPHPVAGAVAIPQSHCELLARPVKGVLSTLMPDGQPQSSLVWVDCDGTYVLINSTLQRQKCRNMQARPHATLLVVDPDRAERWIEVRGDVVEITQEGAIEHADKLTRRYTCKAHFYGGV